MKLKNNQTVYQGGKVFRRELPEDLIHLFQAEPEKAKKIKKADDGEPSKKD